MSREHLDPDEPVLYCRACHTIAALTADPTNGAGACSACGSHDWHETTAERAYKRHPAGMRLPKASKGDGRGSFDPFD